MTEFVSVLIPCRNEIHFLGRCLDSILRGSYPQERMEVLLIDGGSSDGSRELIEDYRHRDVRVRLIDNPERITPCALNRGLDAARGTIIARVDAHATVAPDYLEKCVGYLLSTGADNVGGSMRTLAAEPGWFAQAIVTVLSHRFGVGNSRFRTAADTGNPGEFFWVDTVFGGCWRREVFDRIGHFNRHLRRSQDMEFSRRLQAAGGRTLLVPEIRCDYYARTRFREFCRHNFANGQWAILPFLYSQVIPVSLRHLVPLCFVMALMASCGALWWTPWPLAAVAGAYTCANFLASSITAWKQQSLAQWILLPLVFLVLHLSYGLGSIVGVLQAGRVFLRRALPGVLSVNEGPQRSAPPSSGNGSPQLDGSESQAARRTTTAV